MNKFEGWFFFPFRGLSVMAFLLLHISIYFTYEEDYNQFLHPNEIISR